MLFQHLAGLVFVSVAFVSSPSKIEGVRGSMTAIKELQFCNYHTTQSQCWVELQCLRHHTLSFAQLVFCNLHEHFVVRDSSPILREQLSPLFPDTNNSKPSTQNSRDKKNSGAALCSPRVHYENNEYR